MLVRITGMVPLAATVYECDRLRCNSCGEVYTAAAAQELVEQKYDEGASAMIALLSYRTGVPFHRLEKLQLARAAAASSGIWRYIGAACAKDGLSPQMSV